MNHTSYNKNPLYRREIWRLYAKPISLLLLSVVFFLIEAIEPSRDAKASVSAAVAGDPVPPLIRGVRGDRQPSKERSSLENQAREFYQLGRYQDAINLLTEIVEGDRDRGDPIGQALTLRNLSLAYQELGDWMQAKQAIFESLALLDPLQNSPGDRAIVQNLLALNWESLGQVELMTGNPEAALEHWQNATELFEILDNISGTIRNQTNQVQALQSLGLYRQALKTLLAVNLQLQEQPDNLVKASGMQILGDALRVTGDLEQSQVILEQALAIAETLNNSEAIANTLLSLANTQKLQGEPEIALEHYEQALAISSDLPLVLQTALRLNKLSWLVEYQQTDDVSQEILDVQAILQQLPVSRVSVESRINLASTLIQLAENEQKEFGEPRSTSFANIADLLAIAVQDAERLNDPRIQSYALGNLGLVYEETQQWNEAEKLTNRALFLAQSIQAEDIAYQWEWQRGRILYQQGDRVRAIAAYTAAVNILEDLRTDLVSINSDAQFSFRESVEPVYREFVSILLPQGQEVTQAELVQARKVIESLQIAELDNFFRDACLDLQPVQIDRIDANAAVFYSIILPDVDRDNLASRLETIVAIPGQPLQRASTNLSENQLEKTIDNLRYNLLAPQRRRLSKQNYIKPLAEVYNWLIRPIETNLAANDIQTLVFVLDGQLRNVPISTLYDGEQFLIEKYSVAIAPSLQLIDPKPLVSNGPIPAPWEKLQILTAGLSEARQGFSPLPGVEIELDLISAELPAKRLFNESFTEENFKTTIDSGTFAIVHLATHGEFSSKAEDTFVLTWDGRLNANELDNFLRNKSQRSQPIELLVLSACQTAVGDDRAVLGLAGVAVRAGARSTLASLWYVSDEATSLLMSKFYQQLAGSLGKSGNSINKAEAIRRAQLELLGSEEFSHPYYWAAFVLVGNWL